MRTSRALFGVWLIATLVLLVVPYYVGGPEVEVSRERDGDSEGVGVMPLGTLIGIAILAVGLVTFPVVWLRGRWIVRSGRS